jgi:hypothetical protein
MAKPKPKFTLLKGWQQIAAFLGLPISAAQRWEKSGMPVIRVGGRVQGHRRSARTAGMAERTPKLLASYEAAQTTERLPRQATITGLATELRIIPLLDGSIEGVHWHQTLIVCTRMLRSPCSVLYRRVSQMCIGTQAHQ